MRLLLLLISFSIYADCKQVQVELEKVSKLRELPIKHPVKCILNSKSQVKDYIIKTISEEYPEEKLKYEGVIYEKLGFIASRSQYRDLIVKLYTDELAGLYDPKSKNFIMADWIPNEMQPVILTHELVHALVDQSYDLDKYMDVNLTTDAQLSRAAVAEGDATFVMFRDSNGDNGVAPTLDPQSLVKSNVNPGLAYQMGFPYAAGIAFAAKCFKEKCDYNKFYITPVSSTREVVYGKKYLDISEDILKLFPESKIFYRDVWGVVGFKSFLAANRIMEDPLVDLAGDFMFIDQTRFRWYLKFEKELSKEFVQKLSKINNLKARQEGAFLIIETEAY